MCPFMNKYPQQPQATYDLHGLRSWEVEDELIRIFGLAKESSHSIIHLIVGRGNNSQGAPVVRTLAQDWLVRYGYRYRFAKRQEGGEGVLVISL